MGVAVMALLSLLPLYPVMWIDEYFPALGDVLYEIIAVLVYPFIRIFG